MKIFERGVYLKLGYNYKSSTKEFSTEMFIPFEELKIVPVFSGDSQSNRERPKVRMWQVWHKKYDFFGKLSAYSGERLVAALKDILPPDEFEKIIDADYEKVKMLKEEEGEHENSIPDS